MNKIFTAILLLCMCFVTHADLDIREITPLKAQELGWKIEVNYKTDYVSFNAGFLDIR